MNIADLIKSRVPAPKTIAVELRSFLPRFESGEQIRIRGLSVQDEIDATKDAIARQRAMLSSLPEKHIQELMGEPAMFDDVRQIARLWRACRDYENPSEFAFPSVDFMAQNFTHEELQTLFGFYELAVIEAGEGRLTDEQLTELAEACIRGAGSDETDVALMRLPKPTLVDLFVRLAVMRAELLSAPASA